MPVGRQLLGRHAEELAAAAAAADLRRRHRAHRARLLQNPLRHSAARRSMRCYHIISAQSSAHILVHYCAGKIRRQSWWLLQTLAGVVIAGRAEAPRNVQSQCQWQDFAMRCRRPFILSELQSCWTARLRALLALTTHTIT